jgi:hypothetical protein
MSQRNLPPPEQPYSFRYRFNGRSCLGAGIRFSVIPVLPDPFFNSSNSSTVFLRSRRRVYSSRRRRFRAPNISRSGIVVPANSAQIARQRNFSRWKTRTSAISRGSKRSITVSLHKRPRLNRHNAVPEIGYRQDEFFVFQRQRAAASQVAPANQASEAKNLPFPIVRRELGLSLRVADGGTRPTKSWKANCPVLAS